VKRYHGKGSIHYVQTAGAVDVLQFWRGWEFRRSHSMHAIFLKLIGCGIFWSLRNQEWAWWRGFKNKRPTSRLLSWKKNYDNSFVWPYRSSLPVC
jgi:hypothetical protein